MAANIVLQRKSEDDSMRRFDETPICRDLMDYLQKHETELPSLTIEFGSSPTTPYGCTGKSDCSLCAPREEKEPLPEKQMYFYFNLKNNKLKMNDDDIELFLQIVNKFSPSDFHSSVTLRPALKTVFKTKYIVLKSEYNSAYNILNKCNKHDLCGYLFRMDPEMFTVHDEKPDDDAVYFEDEREEMGANNYFKLIMILNSEEVKNNLPAIVEVLKFCH